MGQTKQAAILLLFWALSSSATQMETYGLGGFSTSRVGGLNAEPENPFAAISNPALLPALTDSRISFSTHSAGASQTVLSEVQLDHPDFRTNDGTDRSGDHQFPEVASSLWAASVQHPFPLPKWTGRKAGVGLVASGPFGNLRSFRSSTPYDFSTLRYGSADSQFKGTLSTGFEIVPKKLSVGAGVSMFITAAGDGDATLATQNPTARLNLDVGLNSAFLAGLVYRYDDIDSLHHFALVYRQSVAPKFRQEFTANVDLGLGTASVPVTMETAAYFEPETWDLDWQGNYQSFKLSIGMSFQRWSRYQPAYLVVESITASRESVRSLTPTTEMRDTWNPKASLEVPLLKNRLTLALGYQYRPSPVESLSGPTNLLDSNTHVVGTGVRYRFPATEFFPLPIGLTLAGQYHHFEPRNVQKTDRRFVGSPGYKYRGNAYSFGLLAELAF